MSDSTKKGWVRIHRQFEDNDLWFLEPFTRSQAWIDLFLNANHKDGSILIRENIVNVKRGQIAWSEITMTKRWKWSKGKVRNFLKYLEETKQIIQQKSNVTTLMSIINYEKYQSDGQQTLPQTGQQDIPQKDRRQYTNKNVNNEKTIFKDSPIFDKVEFAKAFDGWSKDKLKHYYDAAVEWSGRKPKELRGDWSLSIKNWASRDEKEGKLKFKNDPSPSSKEITGQEFYGSMI